MSQFCERCPIRYQATAEIDGVISTPNDAHYKIRAYMGRGPVRSSYQGKMGVLVDKNDRPSWPLRFADRTHDQIIEGCEARLDACNGPIKETRGLIRKREYVVDCPALGSLLISDPGIASAILRAARTELMFPSE